MSGDEGCQGIAGFYDRGPWCEGAGTGGVRRGCGVTAVELSVQPAMSKRQVRLSVNAPSE